MKVQFTVEVLLKVWISYLQCIGVIGAHRKTSPIISDETFCKLSPPSPLTSVTPDIADHHKKMNTDHWIDDTNFIILHIKKKL